MRLLWLLCGYVIVSTLVVAGVMLRHDAHCLEGAIIHALAIAAKLWGDAVVVASLIERSPKIRQDDFGHEDNRGQTTDDCWPHGEPPF